MTLTPKELHQLRLKKHVSLRYLSERLGLHQRTLEEVEEGHINAMVPLLDEWEQAILEAPKTTAADLIAVNPATAGIIVAFAVLVIVLIVWAFTGR